MQLDKLNQWLILCSNLGVLVGIVFLAVEINQSTTVARSSARQAIAEKVADRAILALESEDFVELSMKIFNGGPLTDTEYFQAMSRWYSTMRDWENIHYQYQVGMLSDDEWRGFRLNLKTLFDTPTLQVYWANEQRFFSERFQLEVETILSEKEEEGSAGIYEYVFENTTNDEP